MISFEATLQKFEEKGEKSGWIFIAIPVNVTESLNPGIKTSFRVKGKVDDLGIIQTALIPMGDGTFILPTNAGMRRSIRKREGARVKLAFELDDSPIPVSEDLVICLEDEPAALEFFNSLPKGHQNYFSKWVESAKTSETKVKRITQAVRGLAMGLGYGETIRYFRKQ
ncbi:YdeI/OmpD-associated family protein [Persicitalea jodogahamensis]|uniref:DUF1905 domain-containing protein n=1 Tax=Persicitalea jodogahamensis TaxID=402147 RepID=A0A8J3D5M4_9BACT|nr:YdeI/OmpD-associated family protein [Persicitalea jodogahamensis]GHB77422.1 hypothetical protein GCM10007390_34410 [Persicitalea jodogahamensis]